VKIIFSRRFEKSYRKRVKNNSLLEIRLAERMKLLEEHPSSKILRLHKLKGDQNSFYSFSVTGDVRVILSIDGELYIFHDIGTHSQVY
jgi:mRNA-degrading endonuclease YafQ of YafQ-DinJ toxin-antitoxin module